MNSIKKYTLAVLVMAVLAANAAFANPILTAATRAGLTASALRVGASATNALDAGLDRVDAAVRGFEAPGGNRIGDVTMKLTLNVGGNVEVANASRVLAASVSATGSELGSLRAQSNVDVKGNIETRNMSQAALGSVIFNGTVVPGGVQSDSNVKIGGNVEVSNLSNALIGTLQGGPSQIGSIKFTSDVDIRGGVSVRNGSEFLGGSGRL